MKRSTALLIVAVVAVACVALGQLYLHRNGATTQSQTADVRPKPGPAPAPLPDRTAGRDRPTTRDLKADAPAPAPEPAPAETPRVADTPVPPQPQSQPQPVASAGPQDARPVTPPAPRPAAGNAGDPSAESTPPELAVPLPLAREALGFVGADPEAEAVWAAAINDPNLSPKARADLIEDLNEDGFPDPKHVTPDDLPLIESRLAIIEAHGAEAMDDVNAAAFAEAYKDLVNMYNRLTQ